MNLFHTLFIIVFMTITSYAANMKETVVLGSAGSAMCKIYAEEVGGDVEAFSEMFILTLNIAEKLGYSNDFQSYQTEIANTIAILQKELLQMHGSKLNIYNNWCIKFYTGFKNGIAAGNNAIK